MAARSVFFDEGGIAANILGIPLPVLSLVLGPRSIEFLLLPVHATEVIRMLQTPVPIGQLLSLPSTLRAAAGRLLLLDASIRDEQSATIRTPLSLRHKEPSPGLRVL